MINWCEDFKKLSVHDRQKEVDKKNLCSNCLKSGHELEECTSTTCKRCDERHNTLLHPGTKPPHKTLSMYCVHRPESQVILSTAQILVKDGTGSFVVCRALLDPGSQSNLIIAKLARKLGLSPSSETRPISGINTTTT